MRRLGWVLVAPLAFAGLMACGTQGAEMSVEDAVYLSALEDEELGTEEGEDTSIADEAAPVEFDCSLEAVRERIMNRFDRNRNDQIDGEEGQEMTEHFGGDDAGPDGEVVESDGRQGRRGHQGRRGRGHNKLKRLKFIYDVDQSGDLDEDERAVLEGDLVARCENKQAYLLENFDADEDGELSQEEMDAAREARRAAHQERRADRFDEVDTDGNGEVSREEFEAAREARGERCENRRAAMLEQFDTDGDGELSDEEKAAMREYLREWVRGEHLGEGRPF